MKKNCTNVRTSDEVPISSFIPIHCKLTKCSSVTRNVAELGNNIYYPVAVRVISGVTYRYDPDYLTHVYSISFTENGKHVSIFEQDKESSLKLHSYMMDKNGNLQGTSTLKNHNTWLIRDYDYFVSANHKLCVLFNSEEQAHLRDHRRRRKRGYDSGGKICISLCSFNIDVSMEKSPAYYFHPNAYIFHIEKERVVDGQNGFWKFQHSFAFLKNNLICIASQGNLINLMSELTDKRSSKCIMLLDFLLIESDTNYSIKHLSQRDLSSELAESFPGFQITSEPTILFNKNGTKVLFTKHNIVYSVPNGKLSFVKATSLSEIYWVTDFQHGEIIVNISQSCFGGNSDVNVELLKQVKGRGNYEIYRKFSVKEITNTAYGSFYCHSVCNGSVKIFVEQKHQHLLIVVDPFEKKVLAELSLITEPKNAHVRHVLVNRDEVIVVMRDTVDDTDEEILVFYKLTPKRMYSLKYLAACSALNNYSLNQIKVLKLPKIIESYLELF